MKVEKEDRFFCYRCNDLGHIARNCRTPDDKLNEQKGDVPIC